MAQLEVATGRPPEIDMLAAHDARTRNLRRAQYQVGNMNNNVCHAAHAARRYLARAVGYGKSI